MKIVERHPLWLRWAHWLNVPILGLMVWSGLLIYWANDIYGPFFPGWFYDVFHLDHALAEGMGVHFTVGWLLILDGAVFIVASAFSGHWREFVPGMDDLRKLPRSIRDEMTFRIHHVRKITDPAYTPAQKFAYTGFFALIAIEILTGFAIYKPVQLHWLKALFGGYEGARAIHFVGMLLLAFFVLTHVIQVMRAGWSTFRSMVAGFEADQ